MERRQVVFLCWRQDSNPEGLRHLFASWLNACWQTDWAIEDQAKTWTRQPVPMISKHSAHSTSLPVGFRTWLWRYTCLLLLVFVNFDALAQASDFRIKRRQVVFLCWRQDSNPEGLRHLFANRLNACWQTDWAIEDQAKTWTRQPVPMISKHSAHSTSLPVGFRTWLWRYTDLLLLISMLWRRQAIFEWKGDKLFSSAECRIRTQGLRHLLASRVNACWQTDWALEDQTKTWTRQPVPMFSKHSAHLTPLPFGIHTWLWRYTFWLLLISMLWHRQAIFESKGDKLSSSAEGRIRTQRVSDTFSPADWMPADKPTELSKIKLKNLNSTARPYDLQAFSPPDPTAIWHSHLALANYLFVVVNFDALAQASDFRIERRQVVFLCWRQDSNPEGLRHLFASRLNACWQTDWAIEDQAKTWTRQPVPMVSKHSAHSTTLPVGFRTWLRRYACLLLFVVVNFDALAQASDFRIERRQVVFLCWRQDSNPGGLRHLFANRLNACWQTDWAIEDQAKTWTRQPVPMINKHSAHSTSLPVGFRTWLWRYICLLLLIWMLWDRQVIFESKGDKLFSSDECRIRTQGLRHLFASRLNACWQKDWAIEDQAKKLELNSPSLWSASIQPTWPHCHLALAPGSGDIHVCCC